MRAEPEQREEREGLIHILQSVHLQCNVRYGQIPRLFRVIMSFVFKETVS